MSRKRLQNAGFSLVELVVVIAIMAALVAVVVPQFARYIQTNRTNTCATNREAILAIFERGVYEGTKELSADDLRRVLRGEDNATKEEAGQYDACPAGGSYTSEILSGVAVIHCSHADHKDISVDFSTWEGTDLGEDPVDKPIPPP